MTSRSPLSPITPQKSHTALQKRAALGDRPAVRPPVIVGRAADGWRVVSSVNCHSKVARWRAGSICQRISPSRFEATLLLVPSRQESYFYCMHPLPPSLGKVDPGTAGFGYSLADIPGTHRVRRPPASSGTATPHSRRCSAMTAPKMLGASFRQLYQDVGDFVRVGELWRNCLAAGAIYFDERVMRRRMAARCGAACKWPLQHAGRSVRRGDRPASSRCSAASAPTEHVLTGRQRQILMLVAQGRTSGEIAARGSSCRDGRSRRIAPG